MLGRAVGMIGKEVYKERGCGGSPAPGVVSDGGHVLRGCVLRGYVSWYLSRACNEVCKGV